MWEIVGLCNTMAGHKNSYQTGFGLTLLLIASMSLFIVLASLEIVLRVYPDLISLKVLLDFDRPLRSELTRTRGLTTQDDLQCLPANRRHGKLCLVRPGQRYVMPVNVVDRGYGAIAAIQHDANGFCNPALKASWKRVSVVLVGDSMTWCSGVGPDQAFTAILGERLGRSTYNLGVHGIGLYEYLEVLRRFGLALEPDMVVMVVSSNDLRDALRYWKDRQKKNRNAEDDGIFDAVGGGIERSYAANFLRSSAKILSRQLFRSEIDFHYTVATEEGRLDMNLTNANGDEVETARRVVSGEIDFTVWDQAFDDFATLGKDYGFNPVLAYVPPAHAAYASTTQFHDEQVGRDVSEAVARERAYLVGAAQARGLGFVDATEGLHTAAPHTPKPLYFPGNMHLTPEGHDVVASILAESLTQPATSRTVEQ